MALLWSGPLPPSFTLNVPAENPKIAAAAAAAEPPEVKAPNVLSLLQLCASAREARQVHALMFKSSQITDAYSAARVAEFYAVSAAAASLECARKVLDTFDAAAPSTFMYNAVIRGYLLQNRPDSSALLFLRMLNHPVVEPDHFTFTFALKAASMTADREFGRQVHGLVVKHGSAESKSHIRNKLIHMYALSGSIDDARRVFDVSTAELDVVAWNSMLEGYANEPDGRRLLHELFDEMPVRDTVSWNTMIAFYVEMGELEEALSVFRSMQESGVSLNRVTLVSVLSAVAQMGALGQGKWIHAYIKRHGVELDENLSSALINMYSKCGCVEGAVRAFEEAGRKSVDTWNAMIGGFTANGQSERSLELFSQMKLSVRPNAITYACILNACSHGGLAEEGACYFNEMKRLHGIEPDITHFGCMVDLFCRAGIFKKAEEIISKMPMEPDPVMWKAVLGACRVHGNFDLGEKAGAKLIELAPDDHAGYVLLSNLHALADKWGSVHDVRKMMRKRGIKKTPGCSSVESGGAVHEFIAGDASHPRREEIYAMLGEMGEKLRAAGYEPDTKQVLLDIEEEEVRESSLLHHSEKLAIAFGLISTRPGTAIRVVKNLRVCGDCHNAVKLLSGIYKREIIVRDSNRFHRFENGSCSCGDYW